MANALVSIVIPAYNEEKTIGDCLTALTHQVSAPPFEVVVVDNVSTDKTVTVVNRFADRLNVRLISESVKGRGAARRAGFAKARGGLLLSTDADSYVPPNWLKKLTESLQQDQIAAVTGTMRIMDQGWLTNALVNVLQPLSMRLYRFIFGHYWLSGFNFEIRRDVYQKSGGFMSELNIQEDIELSFRISRLGKILFLPDMPVTVSGRRFNNGLIRGMVPYIKTFIKFFGRGDTQVMLDDVR